MGLMNRFDLGRSSSSNTASTFHPKSQEKEDRKAAKRAHREARKALKKEYRARKRELKRLHGRGGDDSSSSSSDSDSDSEREQVDKEAMRYRAIREAALDARYNPSSMPTRETMGGHREIVPLTSAIKDVDAQVPARARAETRDEQTIMDGQQKDEGKAMALPPAYDEVMASTSRKSSASSTGSAQSAERVDNSLADGSSRTTRLISSPDERVYAQSRQPTSSSISSPPSTSSASASASTSTSTGISNGFGRDRGRGGLLSTGIHLAMRACEGSEQRSREARDTAIKARQTSMGALLGQRSSRQ